MLNVVRVFEKKFLLDKFTVLSRRLPTGSIAKWVNCYYPEGKEQSHIMVVFQAPQNCFHFYLFYFFEPYAAEITVELLVLISCKTYNYPSVVKVYFLLFLFIIIIYTYTYVYIWVWGCACETGLH